MNSFSRVPKLKGAIPTTISALSYPKLTISQPGDAWEQEAEHMARHAVNGMNKQYEPAISRSKNVSLLTANSAGQPLAESTRAAMQSRFGYDFSQVRIHADTDAARSAAQIQAQAYTTGSHIFFGAGQFQPGNIKTEQLLMHELAHVAQQTRSRASTMPLILRQVAEPGTTGPTPSTSDVDLRNQYINLICEVIADIRNAVELGQTWDFEEENVLQRNELVGTSGSPIREVRREALYTLIENLDEMIRQLETGTLHPSNPATRENIRAIWREQHPGSGSWPTGEPPEGHPANWSHPTRTFTSPSGETHRVFQSLGGYIDRMPSTPPGTLESERFPTWWVIGCHTARLPASASSQMGSNIHSGPITPQALNLTPDTVILVNRGSGGEVVGWQWEPRHGEIENWHWESSHVDYPSRPYEWHYDQRNSRVYILVNGRRYNLLPHGQVESQD